MVRALVMSVAVVALLATDARVAGAQMGEPAAANPYIGTWMEDVERTKYPPGQKPPILNVHRWEPWDGDGMKCTILIIDADGKETRATYFQKFDGNWYPTLGEERRDAISSRRIDQYTFAPKSRLNGKGGEGDNGSRHVFSPDGQTMTLVNGKGEAGRVYRKLSNK